MPSVRVTAETTAVLEMAPLLMEPEVLKVPPVSVAVPSVKIEEDVCRSPERDDLFSVAVPSVNVEASICPLALT